MAYGIIGFGQPGTLAQPSGNIWGDCPAQEILDEGTGYFAYDHFIDAVTLPNFPSIAANSGTFTFDGTFDHSCNITTGATSGNGASFWTKPLGPIAKGNGQKFWFEAAIAVASIVDTKGLFVGLTVVGGQIAAFLTNSTTIANNSSIGFFSHSDAPAKFDAVYRNGAAALVTVQADVTNSPTLVANGGVASNIVVGTFVKLGLQYDGQQYITFFVNGFAAAKVAVDATFDQTHNLGGIVSVVTGAAAAAVLKTDFLRVAQKFA